MLETASVVLGVAAAASFFFPKRWFIPHPRGLLMEKVQREVHVRAVLEVAERLPVAH